MNFYVYKFINVGIISRLVIIVAMVLHHIFSSKRDVIEGTTDGPVTDGPEKCGARHEGARRARRPRRR